MSEAPGSLSAIEETYETEDLDGSTIQRKRVKLEFSFPDGFEHSFSVERFEGMKTDENGNEVEEWKHPLGCKFVEGEVAYDNDPGSGRYRALAYRRLCPHSLEPTDDPDPAKPRVLHTGGAFAEATVS